MFPLTPLLTSFFAAASAAPEEEPAKISVKRLCVGHFDHPVNKRHIHGVGYKVIADALDIVIAVLAAAHRGADGIGKHTCNVFVFLFQKSDNAGIGAAAACACDEIINVSV